MAKVYKYTCAICGKKFPISEIEVHQNKCYESVLMKPTVSYTFDKPKNKKKNNEETENKKT